ncbi:MAG: hypothetical protein ACPGQM_08605 [Alphaproteobacteria bacterium]
MIYAWKGVAPPGLIPIPARQVGVERDNYYLLTREDELILFDENLDQQAVLMQQVAQFAAGDSGVLAITHDRNLWWLSGATKQFLARDVMDAAVGDGTTTRNAHTQPSDTGHQHRKASSAWRKSG